VRASQRERLQRAVIAAVAESGYVDVTVADIVRRARVSRVAFYAHYRGKDDCFLEATGAGGQLLVTRVLTAAGAAPPDAPAEEVLRAGCHAFLAFLAEEPAFSRVFYIDMPAAGTAAVDRLQTAQDRFAEINRKWHDKALAQHPEWPAVPDEAYLALAGATAELVRSEVRAGRTKELTGLEDTLVSLHLAVLAGRPWGAGPPAAWNGRPAEGAGLPDRDRVGGGTDAAGDIQWDAREQEVVPAVGVAGSGERVEVE
jgi:AcrR family transcriptional regulator